jgi:hypothetical protein
MHDWIALGRRLFAFALEARLCDCVDRVLPRFHQIVFDAVRKQPAQALLEVAPASLVDNPAPSSLIRIQLTVSCWRRHQRRSVVSSRIQHGQPIDGEALRAQKTATIFI